MVCVAVAHPIRRSSMAGEKTTKKTKAAGEGSASALRLRSDPRKERRYEPKESTAAWISIGGMSVGALLLGGGVYGQWLRAWARHEPEPHKWASWLLLAGALVLMLVAFVGPRAPTPIRVGDAGVGSEKDASDIDRIEWRDVLRIALGGGVLTIESEGNTLSISNKLHAQAVARIVAEARARIPTKVDEIDKDLEELDADAGEVLPLEAPQVAGARCKASEKLITFEKDARLCGRCGEMYHKDAVPQKCLTCDAKLA